MISAMPAVAVRRGRKKSKTFGRFNQQPPSHHSSTASLADRLRRQRLSTISNAGGPRAFRHRRRRFDSEVDRQRRRFLIYTGTLFLISGLLLVFIGVGTAVPTLQTIGLLLIGVGTVLCIIKVFCSEAHAAEVPTTKIVITDATPTTATATPVAAEAPSEFTELPAVAEGTPTEEPPPPKAQIVVCPPNSVPETKVLIESDSGARY